MTTDHTKGGSKSFSVLASGLAHELRNPLNSASLQLSVFLRSGEGKALSEGARARLDAAKSELRRMSDLVDDYLSLFEPRVVWPRAANLSVLVDEAFRRLRERGCPCVIHSDVEPSLPQVMADSGRITQVFMHLIHNSLEALEAAPRPRVQVSAVVDGNMLRISVVDNGTGMADSIRDTAFDAFTTTKSAGTGLGLTLVQRLVGAHGGTTWFDSTSEGTAMYFTLPSTVAE